MNSPVSIENILKQETEIDSKKVLLSSICLREGGKMILAKDLCYFDDNVEKLPLNQLPEIEVTPLTVEGNTYYLATNRVLLLQGACKNLVIESFREAHKNKGYTQIDAHNEYKKVCKTTKINVLIRH